MYISKSTNKWILFNRIISIIILIIFSISTILPPNIYAQIAPQTLNLPIPGTMLAPSLEYDPAILKGIKIYPDEPLKFDFIVDTGDSKTEGLSLKEESEKLIRYFLASLTVPEDDIWVNLSPKEKDRIVPDAFGKTEMGRDLLAQDYVLKQLASSLMYPEGELGKLFWEKVYQKIYKDEEKRMKDEVRGISGKNESFNPYPSAYNLPTDLFSRVWIVPEKAVVYTNEDRAFVVESKLKVMMEEDYEAMSNQKDIAESRAPARDLAGTKNQDPRTEGVIPANAGISGDSGIALQTGMTNQVIKEIILPELEKEVNTGEHFAQLRQIYNSLLLAIWFKRNLKQSILQKTYLNKKKINGIDLKNRESRTENREDPETIYQKYLEAFKKGAYDYIKEEYDPETQQIIPRKYFAGGSDLGMAAAELYEETSDVSMGAKIKLEEGQDVIVSANLKKANPDLAMQPTKPDFQPFQYKPRTAIYPGGLDLRIFEMFPNLEKVVIVNLRRFRADHDVSNLAYFSHEDGIYYEGEGAYTLMLEDFWKASNSEFIGNYLQKRIIFGRHHKNPDEYDRDSALIQIGLEPFILHVIKKKGWHLIKPVTEVIEQSGKRVYKIIFETQDGKNKTLEYVESDINDFIAPSEKVDLVFSKAWTGESVFSDSVGNILSEGGLFVVEAKNQGSTIPSSFVTRETIDDIRNGEIPLHEIRYRNLNSIGRIGGKGTLWPKLGHYANEGRGFLTSRIGSFLKVRVTGNDFEVKILFAFEGRGFLIVYEYDPAMQTEPDLSPLVLTEEEKQEVATMLELIDEWMSLYEERDYERLQEITTIIDSKMTIWYFKGYSNIPVHVWASINQDDISVEEEKRLMTFTKGKVRDVRGFEILNRTLSYVTKGNKINIDVTNRAVVAKETYSRRSRIPGTFKQTQIELKEALENAKRILTSKSFPCRNFLTINPPT